jgi:hypothetical protein
MTSSRKENSSVCHQLEKLWLHYREILKVLTLWASCLVTAMNSVCCTETFRILSVCLYQICSTIKMSEMSLHHDSARPCTSSCTIEAIRESGWTVLLHLPYLLVSHYHIFTCLGLWKAACEDTFVWMTRHYGMLCIIGCRGRGETFMKYRFMLLLKGGRKILTEVSAWRNAVKLWNFHISNMNVSWNKKHEAIPSD